MSVSKAVIGKVKCECGGKYTGKTGKTRHMKTQMHKYWVENELVNPYMDTPPGRTRVHVSITFCTECKCAKGGTEDNWKYIDKPYRYTDGPRSKTILTDIYRELQQPCLQCMEKLTPIVQPVVEPVVEVKDEPVVEDKDDEEVVGPTVVVEEEEEEEEDLNLTENEHQILNNYVDLVTSSTRGNEIWHSHRRDTYIKLHGLMMEYDDDDDKPEDMNRIEYWLAQLDI